MAHAYKFARPAVTVDCVVFGVADPALQVLLIQRAAEPYAGFWALPGGFVRLNEDLEAAARRELLAETTVGDVYLEQLHAFGDIERDPRGRVISVAYYALVNRDDVRVQAATDAEDACWADATDLPALAFDHNAIVDLAVARLRDRVRRTSIAFELLPQTFTLTQLQRLYEIVLDRPLDKRNFRRKVLSMGVLLDTGEKETGVAHRAAALYSFAADRYRALVADGWAFTL